MVNLSYAAQLLPLLLLSPTSRSSENKNSVVLANGFAATQHNLNLRPSFLPRDGSLDNSKSALSSSGSAAIEADIGPALEVISQGNWDLLSDRGKAALSRLILYDMSSGNDGQKHVYGDWPEAGVQDNEKRTLGDQVRRHCLDMSCFFICYFSIGFHVYVASFVHFLFHRAALTLTYFILTCATFYEDC